MKGIIDRIEGDIVTAEMPGCVMRDFALEEFPSFVKTGEVFEISEEGQITMLPEETTKRRQDARSMFDRLKKK